MLGREMWLGYFHSCRVACEKMAMPFVADGFQDTDDSPDYSEEELNTTVRKLGKHEEDVAESDIEVCEGEDDENCDLGEQTDTEDNTPLTAFQRTWHPSLVLLTVKKFDLWVGPTCILPADAKPLDYFFLYRQ